MVVVVVVLVEVEEVLVVVQTFDAIDPDEPTNMLAWSAFELTQVGPQSVWSKSVAPKNISNR